MIYNFKALPDNRDIYMEGGGYLAIINNIILLVSLNHICVIWSSLKLIYIFGYTRQMAEIQSNFAQYTAFLDLIKMTSLYRWLNYTSDLSV